MRSKTYLQSVVLRREKDIVVMLDMFCLMEHAIGAVANKEAVGTAAWVGVQVGYL